MRIHVYMCIHVCMYIYIYIYVYVCIHIVYNKLRRPSAPDARIGTRLPLLTGEKRARPPLLVLLILVLLLLLILL